MMLTRPGLRRAGSLGAWALLVSLGAVATCLTASAPSHPGRSSASPEAAAPAPTSPADAVALLGSSTRAAGTVAYQGVQVVSAWRAGTSSSMTLDVVHIPGSGVIVHPHASNSADVATPTLDQTTDAGSLALLLAHYRCVSVGRDEVAGRPAMVVQADRADGSVAARFWFDADNGVLLRREVFDTAGRPVQVSSFTQISFGAVASPSPSPSAMPKSWQDQLSTNQLAQLRAAGWQVPAQLAGLSLYDARRTTLKDAGADGGGTAASGSTVVQLSYSDGVSTVSLFEQQGRLEPGSVAGWATQRWDGATVHVAGTMPTRVVWQGAGVVYTEFGDAPTGVVRGVVAQLPRGMPANGPVTRVRAGLERAGSWFNPFS